MEGLLVLLESDGSGSQEQKLKQMFQVQATKNYNTHWL